MTWSEAFARYLFKQNLTQQDALFALRSARVKATASQISYWCRGSYPRIEMRKSIERWTRGAVKANLPGTTPDSSTIVATERAKAS